MGKDELDLEQGCRVFPGQAIEVNKRSCLGQHWGTASLLLNLRYANRAPGMLLKYRF